MHSPVSVVTIVKSRTEKLCRLIEQLESCNPLPDELVIVWMCSPSTLSLAKSEKFNIVHKFVANAALPIARARNRGLQEAKSNLLAYINVDAIVDKNFISKGMNAWRPGSVVFTKVTFIPEPQWSLPYETLRQINNQELPSKDNNEIPSRKQEDDHGKSSDDSICSTVFFISKTDFKKTGGFDEGYDGFGLNDEDFFTNCRSLGFSLNQIELHTFAPERLNYRCPINHLLDFVRNAERYHAKWGVNPRLDVLNAYAEAGYINKDFETEGIHVLQLPKRDKPAVAVKSEAQNVESALVKQTA
ncbi:galactosyltransferase-related protein [Alteromonas sp. 1_MG-2023]|uniref:glycosyltransferase family 2 protein n=1 Tax=Alteromonas sp. 1_MG-2023 TaxID=3062669 RepID=UPI0026E167BD|nr:galactosyltransferase-related protein [Alteromonas sp. 1_MG-2023]MDO6567623.1 galactosyltransferase-related protein [Alteromonas sp. 1_MG-2023]